MRQTARSTCASTRRGYAELYANIIGAGPQVQGQGRPLRRPDAPRARGPVRPHGARHAEATGRRALRVLSRGAEAQSGGGGGRPHCPDVVQLLRQLLRTRLAGEPSPPVTPVNILGRQWQRQSDGRRLQWALGRHVCMHVDLMGIGWSVRLAYGGDQQRGQPPLHHGRLPGVRHRLREYHTPQHTYAITPWSSLPCCTDAVFCLPGSTPTLAVSVC